VKMGSTLFLQKIELTPYFSNGHKKALNLQAFIAAGFFI